MKALLKIALISSVLALPIQGYPIMGEIDEKKEQTDYGASDEFSGLPSAQEKTIYERLDKENSETHNKVKIEHSPKQITNYKKIAKLTKNQIVKRIEEYVGTRDAWKTNFQFFSNLAFKVKSYLGFKPRQISRPDSDLYSLLISQRNNPFALHEAIVFARNSQDPSVRSLAIEFVGERRAGFDLYRVSGLNKDLRGFLIFLINLEEGDPGFKEKYFFEFEFGLKFLKDQFKNAASIANRTNLPVIIEFESSALSYKHSPFISSFYSIVEKRALKREKTKSGGVIVTIHPYYAKILSEVLSTLSAEAIEKLQKLRTQYYKNPQAKLELINLAKNATGFQSREFEEKLMELESGMPTMKDYTCAGLFH